MPMVGSPQGVLQVAPWGHSLFLVRSGALIRSIRHGKPKTKVKES